MEQRNVFKEFMAKVRNGERSFVIMADASTSISFISAQHGAAEYFFACKEYEKCDFTGLKHQYETAAIYAQGKLYVVDWFAFDMYSYSLKHYDELLNDGIVDFYKFLTELNTFLGDTAYPMYYKELEATMHNSEYISHDNIMRMARCRMLNHDCLDKTIGGATPDKAAQMLCRGADFETVCREVLYEQRDKINLIKSQEELMDNLINSGKAVEEWEIELANSIKNLDAKNVTVEFELNGTTGEIKLERERILRGLIDKYYFCSFNFVNSKEADKFFKKMGATSCCYSPETNLYAHNIKSISYRGKKIYERKA